LTAGTGLDCSALIPTRVVVTVSGRPSAVYVVAVVRVTAPEVSTTWVGASHIEYAVVRVVGIPGSPATPGSAAGATRQTDPAHCGLVPHAGSCGCSPAV
jgi:hypothetical protein